MQVKVESISVRREDDPEFEGLFVYAVAVLRFQEDTGPVLLQELRSGGLGGVFDTSKSEPDFLAQIEKEQQGELGRMLEALGLAVPF